MNALKGMEPFKSTPELEQLNGDWHSIHKCVRLGLIIKASGAVPALGVTSSQIRTVQAP